MKDDRQQTAIVPCSGIGKSLGSVARETGYALCDELRPESTRLVALSKLVLGDAQAREDVRRCPTITIDGCKLMCAAKLVRISGGIPAREVAVLDAYRWHKELKPDGIAELNADGRRLARLLAEEMAGVVDDLNLTMPRGGHHA